MGKVVDAALYMTHCKYNAACSKLDAIANCKSALAAIR